MKKADRIAREIEIALPKELTREQSISLVREYVKEQFVNAGMCADIAIHDKEDGNPHAHVMLTIRPIEQDGTWGAKQKKEYILDRNGNKIYDPKKRSYKCKSIPATDWNEQTKAEEWRSAWAEICNRALEQNGHTERIDHRSYARQGIDQIPTIHLGVAAFQMEKRGIRTERGNLNREIEVTNQRLRQLKARISKLQNWLKEEAVNTEPPTLADVIQGILSKREQTGKQSRYTTIHNLKAAANMLNFLTVNGIKDMAGLEEKVEDMYGKQRSIAEELKPIDRRLKTLDEHISNAEKYFQYRDIHRKYKQQKPKKQEAFYESHRMELTHYEAAERYLNAVMNGKTGIPLKAWKTERDNRVDLLFMELEAKEPDHFAVRLYKDYKLAAGKTAKSILISAAARLSVFNIQEVRDLTEYDEVSIDTLGDRKTALFIIMPETDKSLNFLIAILFTQLFDLLCKKAKNVYGGRLPIHVRCLIDEAANIGQIPELDTIVSVIRSREISVMLIYQALSQLKSRYKETADTIIGCMDSFIFLGGIESSTLKELSDMLGKETIDIINTGENRGKETSHSLNYQKLGKELMARNELAIMPRSHCILQLSGIRPFYSRKYDYTKHPLYPYTGDADKRNAFDVEAFLQHKPKLRMSDEYQVIEVDLTGVNIDDMEE